MDPARMDNEKHPLLEARAEPSVDDLEEEVKITRQAWLDAQVNYRNAWQKTPKGKRLTRASKVVAWICGGVVAVYLAFIISIFVYAVFIDDSSNDYVAPRRIPLEAHIMSKCPDAKDCLQELVLPAMQNISHLVDFQLSYIGTVDDKEDGVTCKHGAQECLGNILELCAANLYPDPKIYLGFTMCMTRDYQDVPSQSLVRACALEHGISFDSLNDCVSKEDGSVGAALLRDSVIRSADAGVTKSCTIRLDGNVRCIRDGGKWVDCDGGHQVKDLVEDVLELRAQSRARPEVHTT